MVIRLSGWDASMLYSETPTVHMHTLKVAIIDLTDGGQHYFRSGAVSTASCQRHLFDRLNSLGRNFEGRERAGRVVPDWSTDLTFALELYVHSPYTGVSAEAHKDARQNE